MFPMPTTLLGLMLCLGPATQAQNEYLSRPSISAEPALEIPWGKSVTFVCQGPPGAEFFRLEKEGNQTCPDVRISPGIETEARFSISQTEVMFSINQVKEDTAGCYNCIYSKNGNYSPRSEVLKLVVTGHPGSFSPSPTVPYCSSTELQRPQPGDTTRSPNLPTMSLYVLIGISVVFLLCLLLLVLFFLHHRHQRKHRIPGSKGEEKNLQDRFSPGVDVLNNTPGMATVDGLPENDREMDTSTFAAGSPQEVTYAQLNHRSLTQGAARAVSPQSTEPMAEFNTYASIAKR